MSKFTEEQRELINQTRSQIVELNKQQNKLYYDLLRDLNINIYAEDWMFDYIYNESGSIEEIEKQNIRLQQAQERILKQKKRRQENVGIITREIQDRQKRLTDLESIPAFTEYSDAEIRAFVENQFPPDALSILDNLARLTPEARKEIVEFVVLKFKAVTLNTIIDEPGAVDDRYNQLGI